MRHVRLLLGVGAAVVLVSVASAACAAVDESLLKDAAARERIAAAIPTAAPARPLKARRLLVFDLNVNYGGHGSIPHANYALALMGEKTGAYEAVISRDPEVFRPESLRRFDAVFFNNNVGNLFTDAALRRSLAEFVAGGGGMLGVHGTSVAFTQWPGAKEDWPEFGAMLGARGANHREATEPVVLKLDDPGHPLVAPFGGKGFEYRDEFFRFHEVYSRDRLRVIASIDTKLTDLAKGRSFGNTTRADDDYAVAWVKSYGRGRVFYCSIAHNPSVFSDPLMLRFYLGAVQFALGDLPAPTTPSAKLTPALRAQERLGWRFGVEAYTFHRNTLFETIEKASKLGLAYVGGLSFQKVGGGIDRNLEPGLLTDDELARVRMKLDESGVRMLTYYFHSIPGDEAGCRKVFEFARKLGVETIMSEPDPRSLDLIEKFCDEHGINVALHNHDRKASPAYWHPDEVMKLVQGRSRRLGACGDMGYWIRDGIDPIQAARTLKDRLITIQVHDLDARTKEGQDVPWGTGAARLGEFFDELRALGVKPTMIGLEYSRDFEKSMPEVTRSVEFFNALSLKLAGQADR